ncbi:hypothetical protein FLONG3_439 [Fusarium longipes]|uniref:Uncharacterized protein n=1 Tax=Fusarium longipes TaxID=694270 RepID=A0A395TAP1_9HYPO|nr:hypothetical protein FLONG3_439 [Fusarium longipes]
MADSTVIIALIVSVVALIIALAQLLAQVVGTVEGYRRCQAAVMGSWAKKTHRVWHWRQCRYETLFTTPEIVLSSYDPLSSESVAMTGYEDSQRRTFELEDKIDPSHQLVCWVYLLSTLHESIAPIAREIFATVPYSSQRLNNTTWPTIHFRQRSWDFMPPDVVRPYATTRVNDIAILACRAGVTWKDFRPAEGIMEGQGGGHIFSATTVRGIGVMLNYTRISDVENDHMSQFSGHLCVCTPEADMMWFGMLGGNPILARQGKSIPRYRVGTIDELYGTLWEIDPEGIAVKHCIETQKKQAGLLHGVCDIVPMLAPWLRQPCSMVNEYPRPLGGTKGLTWHCVAYKVFYEELKKYNRDGTWQTRQIAMYYEQLRQGYGVEWDGVSKGLTSRRMDFYDTLERMYNETTAYFTGRLPAYCYATDTKWEQSHYIDLVSAHLREAPRSFADGEREVREGRGIYDHLNADGDRYWRGEAMYYYWCYMPDYVRYMGQRGCKNARLVEEAWITLIFRAFLWQRAHIPIENDQPIPSQYYGSRLPIFIS